MKKVHWPRLTCKNNLQLVEVESNNPDTAREIVEALLKSGPNGEALDINLAISEEGKAISIELLLC